MNDDELLQLRLEQLGLAIFTNYGHHVGAVDDEGIDAFHQGRHGTRH